MEISHLLSSSIMKQNGQVLLIKHQLLSMQKLASMKVKIGSKSRTKLSIMTLIFTILQDIVSNLGKFHVLDLIMCQISPRVATLVLQEFGSFALMKRRLYPHVQMQVWS